MSDEKATGRTGWDALVELRKSWRALVVVLLVVTALVLGLSFGLFSLVIGAAEPGSTIKVFGLEMQKAKVVAPATVPQPPDEVASYILPKDQLVKYVEAMPILDGTLAVENGGVRETTLVGDSIGKIRVGSRGVDGRPAKVYKSGKTGDSVAFNVPMYIEIEYRNRVFGMTLTDGKGLDVRVSVEPKLRATLELVSYAALPVRPIPDN